MRRLDNLALHRAVPVRAIYLRRVSGGQWQATYSGDQWTGPFHTPPGERWLVRDAVLRADVRHGLPIVDEDGPATPELSLPHVRRLDVRSGDAA